jgi:hypothetical protein
MLALQAALPCALRLIIPAMLDSDPKPQRSWQEIVADSAQEHSPEKLTELSKELEQVLDQRKKLLHIRAEPIKPPGQKKNHL